MFTNLLGSQSLSNNTRRTWLSMQPHWLTSTEAMVSVRKKTIEDGFRVGFRFSIDPDEHFSMCIFLLLSLFVLRNSTELTGRSADDDPWSCCIARNASLALGYPKMFTRLSNFTGLV